METPQPHLENVRAVQPSADPSAGELDGLSADGSTLAFYSTFESGNILATPIYTMNLATGVSTKLTTDSFSQCPSFTPDGAWANTADRPML